MNSRFSFESPGQSIKAMDVESVGRLEEDIAKHLQVRGVFPSSTRVQEKLQAVLFSRETSIQTLADIVIVDPLLSLRLLTVINSTFYQRGRSVLSLPEGLGRFGLQGLKEETASISPSRPYGSIFKGRGVALAAYQQSILAACFSEKITRKNTEDPKMPAIAYLCAWMASAANVVLAYHRASIYSAACLEGQLSKVVSFDDPTIRIFRKPGYLFPIELCKSMALPEDFAEILRAAERCASKGRSTIKSDDKDVVAVGCSIHYGRALAHALCNVGGASSFYGTVRDYSVKCSIAEREICLSVNEAIESAQRIFNELGCPGVAWPAKVEVQEEILLSEHGAEDSVAIHKIKKAKTKAARAERKLVLAYGPACLDPFMNEIKACFQARLTEGEFSRFPQAIFATLQALVKGIGFSRALFLRHDGDVKLITSALIFGEKPDVFSKIMRRWDNELGRAMPDVQACQTGGVVFNGEPLLKNGWPFVAIPVRWKEETIGLFYADRVAVEADSPLPLGLNEQVGCMALGENWINVPEHFY